MLEGRPAIVISYSERFKDSLARPVAIALEALGFRSILVGDEPLPPGVPSTPNDKIEWFFHRADMAVFLATPDDELRSGEVRTRQNIVDEHRLGHQLPHLRHRLLVFKASEVTLPTNINPVYEQLPADDPEWLTEKIIEQARVWDLVPTVWSELRETAPASPEPVIPASDVGGSSEAESSDQAVESLVAAIAYLEARSKDTALLSRAELAIAGALGEAGGADSLGVHLANRLFAARHQTRLRSGERLLLLRTYLQHSKDENVPGLVWLRARTRREIVELLRSIAVRDGDVRPATEALTLLSGLREPRNIAAARDLLTQFLVHEDFQMRWAAVDYIVARGSPRLRSLLDNPTLLGRDRHRATQAAILMDIDVRPRDALARYAEDSYARSEDVAIALGRVVKRLPASQVRPLLAHPVREVRETALQLAVAKKLLDLASIRKLLAAETSLATRVGILNAALQVGVVLPRAEFDAATDKRSGDTGGHSDVADAHSVEVTYWRMQPAEVVAAACKWAASHGYVAYEARGLEDPKWGIKTVRRDLRSDFAVLKEASRAELTQTFNEGTRGTLGRDLTEVEQLAVDANIAEAWSRPTT